MERASTPTDIDPAQRLAILAPRWGARSETFIHRHLTSILPGRTVAMTRAVLDPDWCPEVPLLQIRQRMDFPIDRAARMFGQWRFDRRSRLLRDYLKEHQVTAVLGEWLNFASHWFPNLRDLNVRFFAHAFGYDATLKSLHRPWHRFLYRWLEQMTGVIVISRLMKERLLDAFKLDANKIHVIPCGVELPPTILKAENESVLCLSVGRMVDKKQPLTTLKAFHAAQRDCHRLRLEFVGAGPLLPLCQRYCQEQGLSDVVTFHGGRPHEFVKERLARADMFLLHSATSPSGDEEGLPVAIVEAMAHGLPVVSTRHSAIPEAVIHGRTGFLVAEHDERGMAKQMRELANQPGLRRQMGEAGRAIAAQSFSVEQEIRGLRQVIFGR